MFFYTKLQDFLPIYLDIYIDAGKHKINIFNILLEELFISPSIFLTNSDVIYDFLNKSFCLLQNSKQLQFISKTLHKNNDSSILIFEGSYILILGYILEIIEKFPNESGKLFIILTKLLENETIDKLNIEGNKFEMYKSSIFCIVAYKLFKIFKKSAPNGIETIKMIKLSLVGILDSGHKFKKILRVANTKKKGQFI